MVTRTNFWLGPKLSLALVFILKLEPFCSGQSACYAHAKGVATMKIELTSSAFQNGQAIPKQYTADGKNISPPLSWSTLPQGTKSLALIVDDPDAPVGTWVHWIVYGLSPKLPELQEAIPPEPRVAELMQGTNSFHKVGYGGPSPPPGKAHRYFFKLYALDTDLALKPGALAKQVEQALTGHTLAEGELMGIYGR
jgi:hypothetical protein